jgi:hypothetical protein
MPGILDAIKGFITGDPLQGIKGIIEEFHKRPLTPEEEVRLKELEMQREQVQFTRDQVLADIAGQNIRAETTSGDWFVRRARPAFMWIITLAIGVNTIIFPIINMAAGYGFKMLEIPNPYLELFGACVLGYGTLRTVDKWKSNGNGNGK